eukprot:1003953-Amphidinium_carterae.1
MPRANLRRGCKSTCTMLAEGWSRPCGCGVLTWLGLLPSTPVHTAHHYGLLRLCRNFRNLSGTDIKLAAMLDV